MNDVKSESELKTLVQHADELEALEKQVMEVATKILATEIERKGTREEYHNTVKAIADSCSDGFRSALAQIAAR